MSHAPSAPRCWRIAAGEELSLDRPRIIGILNLTPDSFSDGGAFASNIDAIEYGVRMAMNGACIIDVGGESTRPGARPVPPAEQIHRTIPVIRGLKHRLTVERRSMLALGRDDLLADAHISIDTTSAAVAEAALNSGATIINDVSAGRDDAKMLELVAKRRCGLILMHRRTAAHQDSLSTEHAAPPDYGGDVIRVVREFLLERCQAAVTAGVSSASIVIDPGLGFGKDVDQNCALMGRIGELCELAYPVLSAASRKSFLGAVTGVEPAAARIVGSASVSVLHWAAGVRLFRVHDVPAHREALAVAQAISPNGQSFDGRNLKAI
jgi:dihydropteroate synthase